MFCYEDPVLDHIKREYEQLEGRLDLEERHADAREYLAEKIRMREEDHRKDCPICGRERETAGWTTEYSTRKKKDSQKPLQRRKATQKAVGLPKSMTTRPHR